jgi:hypothetical protein
MFACGVLVVYSSFAKVMGMRMTVVDGEMAMFVQIGVCFRGISVWDDDPRWWKFMAFSRFLVSHQLSWSSLVYFCNERM